jgi:glutamyl/glutaminyl-tRNA synthetase
MALAAPARPGEETRYPGTCRDRHLEWQPGRSWRIRLGQQPLQFRDRRLGLQRQIPADQCGDLQAMDRLGNWTYQFAVTVDDWLMGVNFVIRGEDLLPSTGRQIRLAELLGRRTPAAFLHHPLILKPGGQKLSKAARDSGIRELRSQGRSPALVLGMAASAVGLVEEERELQHSELPSLFPHLFAQPT